MYDYDGFKKSYNRINISTMEETIQVMNISETIIDTIKLLYAESDLSWSQTIEKERNYPQEAV